MYNKELKSMIDVAKIAMSNIMKYFNNGFNVEIKSDNSPVTEADKTTDALIKNYLSKEFPTYSFLTEESVDDKARLNNDYVFIVDPLDGTEDFVHHRDEFTTNIALVYKHEPVVGVIGIPSMNLIYYAVKNEGAYKLDCLTSKVEKIHVNDKNNNLTVYKSVFHSSKQEEELYQKYSNLISRVIGVGSSCKACFIAEGKGEISYRLNKGTKEWDTAAFQIIVEEAGGYVLKLDKTRMLYNREDVYNDTYIILNNLNNWLI